MDFIISNSSVNNSLIIINHLKKSEQLVNISSTSNELTKTLKLVDKGLPEFVYLDGNIIEIGKLSTISNHYHYNPIVFLEKDRSKFSLKLLRNIFDIMQQRKLHGTLKFYNIRKKVIQELEFLHFNFSYNGVCYLIESITFASFNKNYYLECNLEKDLFPTIAKKLSVTTENLKWSINKAIDCMYDYHKSKKIINQLSQYFKENIDSEKPTVKMIINTILYKL